MRLWIMSDLHIELTRGWDLPAAADRPAFDVLIIAGDLIPGAERGVAWLRERVADRPVIYVMGNHESYGGDIDRTLEKARVAAEGTNVFVVENECVRIGHVIFAGCTLWTDFAIRGDAYRGMAVAGERMNDFKKIRTANYRQRFLPRHALTRHLTSVAFLESEMRKRRNGKLVVVSHHAPIPEMTDDPGGSGEDHTLDPAYRSDLRRRLMVSVPDDGSGALQPADLWVFGHTHSSFDAEIGETTRVVSNAKGYGPWPGHQRGWDNPNFNEKLVIEI
ncbi:metallophosphoesterase [Bradyrhizobium sp. CCGUVB1N3]|uniref:metallophosphoesterase n=1 Tax=Bradyrhizobium sp. CCGUVB1N3 TaxID=2949629 RepID=UPI0020B414A1|nr:metallophosphoesterase [Bradyrhizobium sp. CCGUVB1N3]MCP3471816.1 metallophosphoesterase [Bradyrhizobium sp. CCGUVB1N3]MCP3473598.1 metallophosphoesterase [Bradyrhizobium sp. CCGUVB1N3]